MWRELTHVARPDSKLFPPISDSMRRVAARGLLTDVMRAFVRVLAVACAFAAWPVLASEGHADPSAPVVLGLAVILLVAKLAGDVAVRRCSGN
jgi:hypothetical protein